jgi:coenzyme F420-reducing hydrogenase gamma subunit
MLSDVAYPRKLLLKKCYPNAANWPPGRRMAMVCMDCVQKLKKLQICNVEMFERFWNHFVLMEHINAYEENLEKGLICAGPELMKVFLADAKCPTPGKLGLSHQDPQVLQENLVHILTTSTSMPTSLLVPKLRSIGLLEPPLWN